MSADARAKPNWRRGYHETIAAHIEQMRRDRSMRPTLPAHDSRGRRVTAGDLSDSQIEEVARLLAEKDTNRAIHDWNSAQVEARRNAAG